MSFGNEPRNGEGLRNAGIGEGHLADIVAVVQKTGKPMRLKRSRYSTCLAIEARCSGGGPRRVADPPFVPLFNGPALGQVAD